MNNTNERYLTSAPINTGHLPTLFVQAGGEGGANVRWLMPVDQPGAGEGTAGIDLCIMLYVPFHQAIIPNKQAIFSSAPNPHTAYTRV